MIRFRFSGSPSVLGWVEAIWRSDLVRSQIENSAKTSAGIWKVSQDDLLRIRLPLPPELECRLALERSSELMRSTEEATSSLDGELSTISRLRQSVLAAAFSGKLVPQDPADEPASALLERLRTQKAAAPMPRRGIRAARTTSPRRAQSVAEETAP